MIGIGSDPRTPAKAKARGGIDRRGRDRDHGRSVGRGRSGRGNPDAGEAVRTFVVAEERRREVIPVWGVVVVVVVVVLMMVGRSRRSRRRLVRAVTDRCQRARRRGRRWNWARRRLRTKEPEPPATFERGSNRPDPTSPVESASGEGGPTDPVDDRQAPVDSRPRRARETVMVRGEANRSVRCVEASHIRSWTPW